MVQGFLASFSRLRGLAEEVERVAEELERRIGRALSFKDLF
jgi:hypothetical protein